MQAIYAVSIFYDIYTCHTCIYIALQDYTFIIKINALPCSPIYISGSQCNHYTYHSYYSLGFLEMYTSIPLIISKDIATVILI